MYDRVFDIVCNFFMIFKILQLWHGSMNGVKKKSTNEDYMFPNIFLWIVTCQYIILGLNTYFRFA